MKKLSLFFVFLILIAFPCPFSMAGDNTKELQLQIDELKRIQESDSKILAETAQTLTSMRQELQAIQGAADEAKYFTQEESSKNDKMLKDYDLRLTSMEEKLSLYGNQLQDFLGKPTVAQKGKEEETALYKKGLSEINVQNYKSALQIFNQFMTKYPKSSLTPNAQYWKGEALYALREYPQAVLEFQKVVKKYPKSNKVPGAILRQGYCFYETQSYLDAKAFLQKVAVDFPNSDEAGLAKEKIQTIDHLLAQNKNPGKNDAPTTQKTKVVKP